MDRLSPEGLLAALRKGLGERATAARAVLEAHGRSEAYHATHAPDVAVVAAIVRGGVCIDLARMDHVLEIDPDGNMNPGKIFRSSESTGGHDE